MYGAHYHFNEAIRKVDQLYVWSSILNESARVGYKNKYLSPFRPDNNAGCYLRKYNNIIFFTDQAYPQYNKYTCIHAVAELKNIHINDAASMLMNGGFSWDGPSFVKKQPLKEKKKVDIQVLAHDGFSKLGLEYWSKRGFTDITELQSDQCKLVDVKSCVVNGSYFDPVYPCFAFVFENGNTKIYMPECNGNRFISNTDKSDVWTWTTFPVPETCIVTKSFKDGAILNKMFPDVDIYAFMNEGVIHNPTLESIAALHEKCLIIFDNDKQGRRAAVNMAQYLPNSKLLFYPKYHGKDSDDLYLRNKKLLYYIISKEL